MYAAGEDIPSLAQTLGYEKSSLGFLGGDVSGFPIIGEEVVDAVDAMGAEAMEDVMWVAERIGLESLAVMKLVRTAALLPAFSLPRKSQFFHPTATPCTSSTYPRNY